MQYSRQIPTMLASAFWRNRGLNRFMPSLINRLGLVFAPIHNRVENLLCIVEEHLLSIEPQLAAAIPPPAKRVKN